MNRNRNTRNSNPIINRITVNVPPNNQPRDKFERWGNYSDWLANGINLLAVVGTIILLYVAFHQNELAQNTLDEAQRANKISVGNLKLAQQQFKKSIEDAKTAKIEQAKRDSEDAVNRRKQFKLDSTSTQAQIDALNESQRQFAIQNEPFLETEIPVQIDTLEANKPVFITLRIKNLGKYPVKIIKASITYTMKYKQPDFKTIYKKELNDNITGINQYITYESPYYTQFVIPQPISREYYNAIINLRMPIYIYGFFIYTNLVTKKNKQYSFMVKKEYINTSEFSEKFIINDNMP